MKRNQIKIILFIAFNACLSALAANSQQSSAQAVATALGQSTGQPNQNSVNGGMVYNNVTYENNGKNPQQNKVITVTDGSSSSVQSSNNNCSSCTSSTAPKKVYKKKYRSKRTSNKKPKVNSWAYQKFDIDFNDDVSKLPDYLSQFDPTLVILPNLGKKTPQHITISIQQASIDDIAKSVDDQSSSAAKIIYNPNNDSIRISYQSMVDYGTDAMQQSIAWQNGKGKPKPILGADGMILFPYGQYSPTIICKPLQVCDLQFDKGEKILDANIGDSTSWVVTGALSGVGPQQIQHIELKPMHDSLTTNLVVTTNMNRTYSITLQSSNKGYVSMAGFYYPQQMNNELDNRLNRLKTELGGVDNYNLTNVPLNATKGKSSNGSSSNDDELPGLRINRNYKITVDQGHPSWKPLDVFDDGVHTYIRVSPDFVHSDKDPILMGVDENGQNEAMNYVVKGNYFVTDVIFDRAIMIDNINDKADTVYITRGDTSPPKNWLF